MMRRTTSLRISSLWKDHSEQIKQFIALGSSEKKMLEHARAYIHNLNFKKSLAEYDDVFDLTLLLPKVEYPKNTSISSILHKFIVESDEPLTSSHVKSITSFLFLSPESISYFLDNVFSSKVFLSKFDSVLKEMELKDITSLGTSMSQGDAIVLYTQNGCNSLLTIVGNAIQSKVFDSSAISTLGILKRCEFPIWKYVPKLPRKVEALFTKIDSQEALDFFLSLEKDRRNHREWVIVFQQLLCRILTKLSGDDIVRIFQVVTQFHVPIKEKIWSEIFQYANDTDLNIESLEVLCSSISSVDSVDKLSCQYKLNIAMSLCARIVPQIEGISIMRLNHIRLLLSYGHLSPTGAQKIFSGSQSVFDVSPHSVVYLCKLMHIVGKYPSSLVSQIVEQPVKLSQEECVFVLNAIFSSGLTVLESHLQQAVGSFAFRQFSSRKGARGASLSTSSAFLLLNVLCHLDSTKYNAKLFPIKCILQTTDLSIGERLTLLSASIQYNKNTSLSKYFLQDVLRKANQCNQKQLQIIFLALATLRIREALVFTKLLRIAEGMEASVSLVICAAKAARSLRLTQQFSRTSLVESIKDLSGTTFDCFIELLKYCTKSQREHLIQLPGGRVILEQADMQNVSTGNLLILVNTASVHRKEFLELLRDRSPMKVGDVTSEEIVLNLEEVTDEKEAELILRIGGSCLNELDERQLMRIYHCLDKLESCPNIAFRILGRTIMKNIISITADEALLWLNIYVKYEVRDDAVAKLLIKKAQSRKNWVSKDLDTQMRRAENFYGVSHQKIASRKERTTAYFSTTL